MKDSIEKNRKIQKGAFALIAALCALLFAACEQGVGVGGESGGGGGGSDTPGPAVITGIRVASPPDIIVYARNQPFDLSGLAVEAVYSDESVLPLAETDYTLSPETVDTTEPGQKTITVTAGKHTAQFKIRVNLSDKLLQSIELTAPPSKTSYELGENLNMAGIRLTGVYSDGSRTNESLYVYKGYDKTRRGTQTITVTINKKPVTFDVQVKIPASAELSVNPFRAVTSDKRKDYQQVYIKGEEMGVPKGLRVTVIANGITVYLTEENGGLSAADISGYNPAVTGMCHPLLTLDGASIPLDIYVANLEPQTYFDYGYMRTAADPDGKGAGAGVTAAARYSVPQGRPLVITPVVFLFDPDTPLTYVWSRTDGTAAYTTHGPGNKYLKVTPSATGSSTFSVTVSGKANGVSVSKSAQTAVLCTPALTTPPASIPNNPNLPLRNFAPGQFAESGNGYGWSLGTAGGYEVWKLRQLNNNTANIHIEGNAFGGWSEAGIIWVSIDENNNGLPDDTWYELKGSDEDNGAYKSLTTRQYAVHYISAGDDASLNQYGQLISMQFWVDSKRRRAIMGGGWPKNWGVPGDWVRYGGTLLRDTGEINSGAYGGLDNFAWGYVDSYCPEYFNINNAIQQDGTAANLPWIDFIKVQTAIFRYGGVFGDVSTEIYSADGLGPQSTFPKP